MQYFQLSLSTLAFRKCSWETHERFTDLWCFCCCSADNFHDSGAKCQCVHVNLKTAGVLVR